MHKQNTWFVFIYETTTLTLKWDKYILTFIAHSLFRMRLLNFKNDNFSNDRAAIRIPNHLQLTQSRPSTRNRAKSWLFFPCSKSVIDWIGRGEEWGRGLEAKQTNNQKGYEHKREKNDKGICFIRHRPWICIAWKSSSLSTRCSSSLGACPWLCCVYLELVQFCHHGSHGNGRDNKREKRD